jgi:S-adenosylmethionine-diacylglycerol 3-amino-3-carboxypropyl transferase
MNTTVISEIASKADFSRIRYAQCWEDADVLLRGLDIQPEDHCLSIASAGDNALAMLTRNPAQVLALDLNPSQLYCLELRCAAYRRLTHKQLLMLMGSRPCDDRFEIYALCRSLLSEKCALFWDQQKNIFQRYGIGGVGKFERYFRLFRNWTLPLCQSHSAVKGLFAGRILEQRNFYYEKVWNNWRWRLLARLFFSQTVMGRLGRDPAFFAHIEGSFSEHIARRIRHALCDLDPVDNPYLHWILTATHGQALPVALRPENFDLIRENLHKINWRLISIEDFVNETQPTGQRFHKFNLSDIFEYIDEDAYRRLLAQLLQISVTGGRLLYWNMLTPRSAPADMREQLNPLRELAQSLHQQDQAFFYNRLVIEEIL